MSSHLQRLERISATLLAYAVLLSSPPAMAGEKAPLPRKLLEAKTAWVVNDGSWSKAFDKFYAELKKWNRFQLVEAKDAADIVIVLSTQAGEFGGGVATSGGVVLAGTESKFYIRITDAKDGTPLWSDYTGEGWGLVSNAPKKLVKTLKERMEPKPNKRTKKQ